MFTPATQSTGHGRSLRVAVVLVALFVLLGVVAFASRTAVDNSSRTQPTPTYISWAMSVFLVIFVLMIPFAVYAYWTQQREFRAKNDRSFEARIARSLAFFFLAVLIGGVIMYYRAHHGLFGNGLHIPGLGNGANTPRSEEHTSELQ